MRRSRRRRFGQHFLTDRTVIAQILEVFAPRSGDMVLEIGPGRGALTVPLQARVMRLLAVEIDHDLAAALQRKLAGTAGFRLLQEDFLKTDLDSAAGWLMNGAPAARRLRVLGNLPYAIATAIISRLLPRFDLLDDLTVMVQKEVAERILAGPGDPAYGAFSVRVGLQAEVEKCLALPPACFSPPPAVDSSVLRLQILDGTRRPARHRVLKAIQLAQQAFLHRRKTAQRAFCLAGFDPAAIRRGFRLHDLAPKVRAQEMSTDDFLHLADHFQAAGEQP